MGSPLQLQPSGTACPWALITLGTSGFPIYSPWRPASSPGLLGGLGTRLLVGMVYLLHTLSHMYNREVPEYFLWNTF